MAMYTSAMQRSITELIARIRIGARVEEASRSPYIPPPAGLVEGGGALTRVFAPCERFFHCGRGKV